MINDNRVVFLIQVFYYLFLKLDDKSSLPGMAIVNDLHSIPIKIALSVFLLSVFQKYRISEHK